MSDADTIPFHRPGRPHIEAPLVVWEYAFALEERCDALAARCDALENALREAAVLVERMGNGATHAEVKLLLDRLRAALAATDTTRAEWRHDLHLKNAGAVPPAGERQAPTGYPYGQKYREGVPWKE